MAIAKKSLLISWICLAGVLAASIPARSQGPPDTKGMTVVKYNGPRYNMTEEDLELVRESWRTGGAWEKPEGMPVIEIDVGTILDFGAGDTITKRSGQHLIGAESNSNCAGTTIVQVKDFGCGTGCITMSSTALSGFVFQEYHANPYPTMDVWSGLACTGTKQHFGVEDLYSCTNSNTNGFQSFIGWFNC